MDRDCYLRFNVLLSSISCGFATSLAKSRLTVMILGEDIFVADMLVSF